MSKTVNIGQRCRRLDVSPPLLPFSRVTIIVGEANEEQHVYTAGDDTGRELEISNPWGTQAQADAILAQVRGYIYTPYTAQEALLPPDIELGDGVVIDGTAYLLAEQTLTFDALCASEIGAPAADEIDDEYPYELATERKFTRQINSVKTELRVGFGEIEATVSGIVDELDDKPGTAEVENSIRVALEGITISTSTDVGGQNNSAKITLSDGDIGVIATGIITMTNVVAETITGKLKSDKIDLYGKMTVYKDSTLADTGGYLGYFTGSDTADSTAGIGMMNDRNTGQMLCSSAGAKLFYGNLNGVAVSDSNGQLYARGQIMARWAWESNDSIYSFFPEVTDSRYYLGMSTNRWGRLYVKDSYVAGDIYDSSGSVIVTSDARKKHSIEALPVSYSGLFDALIPRRFKYDAGSSGRYHVGFIAQEVEQALTAAGLSTQDFGGFVIASNGATAEEEEQVYMLRYAEFMALAISEIQALKERVRILGG